SSTIRTARSRTSGEYLGDFFFVFSIAPFSQEVESPENPGRFSVRSLVEAQISRIKRCIGERLLTQELASQEGEGIIIANLLNRWNAFGKRVCVKNA
ncbi:hypothetical protein VSR82_37310, partial [Burkholderia sp. JPY481]